MGTVHKLVRPKPLARYQTKVRVVVAQGAEAEISTTIEAEDLHEAVMTVLQGLLPFIRHTDQGAGGDEVGEPGPPDDVTMAGKEPIEAPNADPNN